MPSGYVRIFCTSRERAVTKSWQFWSRLVHRVASSGLSSMSISPLLSLHALTAALWMNLVSSSVRYYSLFVMFVLASHSGVSGINAYLTHFQPFPRL